MDIYFGITSKLGKTIEVTKKYWEKILMKHSIASGLEDEVKETLKEPVEIRQSKKDPDVYLYYSRYKKYYLCVVTRHKNKEGFVITVYVTDNVKVGRVVWKK